MLETDIRLGQSFLADMDELGLLDSQLGVTSTRGSVEVSDDGEASLVPAGEPSGDAVEKVASWRRGLFWSPVPGNAEPPPPGEKSKKFAEETMKEVELLEDFVDRWEGGWGQRTPLFRVRCVKPSISIVSGRCGEARCLRAGVWEGA